EPIHAPTARRWAGKAQHRSLSPRIRSGNVGALVEVSGPGKVPVVVRADVAFRTNWSAAAGTAWSPCGDHGLDLLRQCFGQLKRGAAGEDRIVVVFLF